jgi:transketolase
MWTEQVKDIALGIRRRAFEHTVRAHGGYLSQACSLAELLATLYVKVLQIEESEAPLIPKPFPGLPSARHPRARLGADYHGPTAPHLDRLIISASSYSLAVYSALTQTGRLDGKATDLYRQDAGSLDLWGAPYSPGMELHSGVPGSGLAVATGIAMGRKLRGENGRVWVLIDADELRSGLAWETLQLLKHKPLTNLTLLINHHYYDESAGWAEGFYRACDPWEVHEVNGHEPMELYAASQIYVHEGPLIIRANTHPCQGMVYLSLAGLPLDFVRFKTSRDRMNFEGAVRSELYKPKMKR